MITYTTLNLAAAAGVAPWDNANKNLSNTYVQVFYDRYPVTTGHLLFVPRINTTEMILVAMGAAIQEGTRMVNRSECNAFNIGLNMGKAAGQTVMYPHVHLIPRRVGDCEDPVGGVRGVIPGQANYKKADYQLPA